MNFKSVGSTGLADGASESIVTNVDAPTVVNTAGYSVKLDGKLKIVTTQAVPSNVSADTSWSTGVVSFANATGTPGKIIINSVLCPFKLTVHHASGNSSDATRKLKVTFNGADVSYDGGPSGGVIVGWSTVLDSTTTSTQCLAGQSTNVEIFGWNGSQGAGYRVYDVTLEQ